MGGGLRGGETRAESVVRSRAEPQASESSLVSPHQDTLVRNKVAGWHGCAVAGLGLELQAGCGTAG